MERRLGISLYPRASSLEQDKKYIDLAARHGFKRLFSCLLSVGGEEGLRNFQETSSYASSKGFEVVLDVAPSVFTQFGISPSDLEWFKSFQANGIRLDSGFEGMQAADLTFNKLGLSIELNMSNDSFYLENALSYGVNKNQIQGCHNFYPQKYTGLSHDHFIACSRRFKKENLRTAAFVSSQTANLGPWAVNDGLCTLEAHRTLPISAQAKELWATGLIDDVIIGNAYASESELAALSCLDPYILELDAAPQKGISLHEHSILFDILHFRRGDLNDYMVRSTEIRLRHTDSDIPALPAQPQNYGDIFIGNKGFGQYKGELQLIIKGMPADPRKNLAAKVCPHDQHLIPYIGAWQKFRLKEY